MDKREEEVSKFASKVFSFTMPKNFVGEPFSLLLISVIEKVWIWEGGGGSVKIFRRKFLVAQYRKFSLVKPLVCH